MVRYMPPVGAGNSLFEDMLKQNHLLIAGPTGCGKSNLINGIMATALYQAPYSVLFILIDPKKVELMSYKNLPHIIRYESESTEMIDALKFATYYIDSRYKTMQSLAMREYSGTDVYVVIDNVSDLIFVNRNKVLTLLQQICQSSRGAKFHVIASAQSPLAKVLPSEIRVNFTSVVAFKTRTAQESRSIIGRSGCEKLIPYRQAIYTTPESSKIVNIPLFDESESQRLINHWMSSSGTINEKEHSNTLVRDDKDQNIETIDMNDTADMKDKKPHSFISKLFGLFIHS